MSRCCLSAVLLANDLLQIQNFKCYRKLLDNSNRKPRIKKIPADFAAVRFLSRMHSHVHLQSAVSRKGLSTLRTARSLEILVLLQDVLIQILLGHHSSVANLTFVLCLVVCKLLMNVQGIGICAYFGTHVTHYWLLLVNETYVIRQISLDLVLFGATVTWKIVLVAVLSGHVNLYFVLVLVAVFTLIAVVQLYAFKTHCFNVLSLDVRVQSRLALRLKTAFIAGKAIIEFSYPFCVCSLLGRTTGSYTRRRSSILTLEVKF